MFLASCSENELFRMLPSTTPTFAIVSLILFFIGFFGANEIIFDYFLKVKYLTGTLPSFFLSCFSFFGMIILEQGGQTVAGKAAT